MTQEETFKNIYKQVWNNGKLVSPRNQKVIEIENFSYELPPYVRFANFKSRKLKLDYIKREFLWYLKGDAKDLSIVQHAKLWESAVTPRGTINSNYGQYIFGEVNQFDHAAGALLEDKDSRRASIMILGQNHIQSDDSDRPCTYSLNFRIREDRLNMSVHMRSQDAIFGFGSDVPCFTFIHEMMLHRLAEVYPLLRLGNFHCCADSFHVYERHFAMLRNIVDQGDERETFSEVECPRISGAKEVQFLRDYKFDSIPEDFQFTKWLLTYES